MSAEHRCAYGVLALLRNEHRLGVAATAMAR